jgi:hypothetical protein
MANDRLADANSFINKVLRLFLTHFICRTNAPTPFFFKNLRYPESCKFCGIAVKKMTPIGVFSKSFVYKKKSIDLKGKNLLTDQNGHILTLTYNHSVKPFSPRWRENR